MTLAITAGPAVAGVCDPCADPYVVPPRVPAAVYWRRRLAVLALLALVVAAVLATAGRAVGALGDDPASVPERPAAPTTVAVAAPRFHVVQAGDTVWSIARTIRPRGDLRPTVRAILAANGGQVDLQPGDRVRLP